MYNLFVEIVKIKMTKHTKAIIISNTIYIAVFIISWWLLSLPVDKITTVNKSGIAALFTFVVSPRVTRIQMQSGEKLQIKWLFSKKVIII